MSNAGLKVIAFPAADQARESDAMLEKYLAIRRQLATAWLQLPEDELARQYAADTGTTYRDICNSGLQYQAPLPTDIEFRAGLIRLLGEKSPPAPGTLLAAQLYLAPP